MATALTLPSFSDINLSTFEARLDTLLSENLATIETILKDNTHYTWENLMIPMDALDDKIERFWSPLSHLHAVVNSKELRACYQACLPKFSAYEASILQNETLYRALKSLSKTHLSSVESHILTDQIQAFELSGVSLSAEKKSRFEAIQTRLSALSNTYENHLLDATQAFTRHFLDDTRLKGLPSHTMAAAKERASEKGESGYVLSLEAPDYIAVAMFADDRALRQEFYEAYVTRASDVGPYALKFDNSPVMNEILALRHEKATLLGFEHYAALSLATKMADSSDKVLTFLQDLAAKSKPQALKEIDALNAFAKTQGQETLMPWDLSYYAEKLRQAKYAINDEMLRPYFPTPNVMQGLFEIIHRLYGVTLVALPGVDTWHKDVMVYALKDNQQQTRGVLYVDLYARTNKRGGAWMDSCQSRRALTQTDVQIPIAFLTCNFAKPTGGKPGLLSHDEVETLFHEMGHCLHHLLTQVDYHAASGINGVEWDAVELPSQFFEHWCWEKQALSLISAHHETGETLPDALYEKMMKAKHFQSGMAMMRQLEFSLFDFKLHMGYDSRAPHWVADVLAKVRQDTAVIPIMPYNRFQHSFSHIFAGGYAAGYYSYKWAEVLSADAYSRFEEEGVFNAKTGQDFLKAVLEVGGSKSAKDAFIAFRGREPDISALLRHNGIVQYAQTS